MEDNMENVIFNGPFSMPIMEDSTTLSDTIVFEVTKFVKEQYNMELDRLDFSVSSQIDLMENPSNHKYKTIQKLIIRKKDDKFIAQLIIKSKLECK